LYDPLGLLDVPLDVLPEPPRIVSGPPRTIRADRSTIDVRVEAASSTPLIGWQVEVEGRAPRFVPVEEEEGATRIVTSLTIDGPWTGSPTGGPWPADVCLRAVSRAGVLSAPWRVYVESAR
jgi:hypothetical protein